MKSVVSLIALGLMAGVTALRWTKATSKADCGEAGGMGAQRQKVTEKQHSYLA